MEILTITFLLGAAIWIGSVFMRYRLEKKAREEYEEDMRRHGGEWGC